MSSTIRSGRTSPAVVALLLVGMLGGACSDDDTDPVDGADGSAAGRGGSTAGKGGEHAGHGGDHDAGDADGGPTLPEPATCDVVPPTKCVDPELTYADDVKPIIAARCLSCHDGKGEQWPLVSEGHVASWFSQIRDVMIRCQMPPADSGITMPTEERETILQWLRCKF